MAFASSQPAAEEPVSALLSRANTLDAALNELGKHEKPEENSLLYNWHLRPAVVNDTLLRSSFLRVLAESEHAPDHEKLIMYDACDEGEVRASMGVFRKRLDARRNTKPKKPDAQTLVCTPFDPSGFHFGKIKNDKERLVRLMLDQGRYDVLTNKFPLFPKHMLLVAGALVPQQMTRAHLNAITQLLQPSSFCAYYNSWCASASVNHFHCHVIDEFPPVTQFPLVGGPLVGGVRILQPQGFPGWCYVYPIAMLDHVDLAIRAMQADNQPHNVLFTPRHVYVFPKPVVRPPRSFELYPETVGGPELIGSFTVYNDADYGKLSSADIDELVRINTAPMPSRLLQLSGSAGLGADDMSVHMAATTERAMSLNGVPMGRSHSLIGASRTLDALPSLPRPLHAHAMPQDRPIARALAPTNFGLV